MSFILYIQGPVFQGSIFNFSPALTWPGSILTSLSCFLARGVSSPVSSAGLCSQPLFVLPRKLCQLLHQPPASPVLHLFWLFSLHLTHPFVWERNAVLLVTLHTQRVDTQAQPTLILRSPLWSGSGSDHCPGASPPGIACRSQLGPCRPQRLLSEPSHSRFCLLKVLPLLCRFCLRTSLWAHFPSSLADADWFFRHNSCCSVGSLSSQPRLPWSRAGFCTHCFAGGHLLCCCLPLITASGSGPEAHSHTDPQYSVTSWLLVGAQYTFVKCDWVKL